MINARDELENILSHHSEIEKGYEVEFDEHLSKYIHNEDGVSYYSDDDLLFHECPNCNCRCNCIDQPCSCCNEA